jgi:predicted RNase H-like HicB family nuclease
MPAMLRSIIVRAIWDDEAQVWVATSEDVPGLVTGADSIEELRTKILPLIEELIELNNIEFARRRSHLAGARQRENTRSGIALSPSATFRWTAISGRAIWANIVLKQAGIEKKF